MPGSKLQGMARLDVADYLKHLRSESARFREVLSTCAPRALVPGCPAWNAADLLCHLTEVQHCGAHVVRSRPASPDGYTGPARAGSHSERLTSFDAASDALTEALEDADPAEPAWTWSTEQTVGFILRRQAHEALIHRVDAEQAAGSAVTGLDPALAADGVAEVLDVLYGAHPSWGTFSPLAHYVRLDLTDVGESVWVQLGHLSGTDPADGVHYEEDEIAVVADPGTEADAVVEGPADAMDVWLWRRGDDAAIRVHGDKRVYDHFRAAVHHPIS